VPTIHIHPAKAWRFAFFPSPQQQNLAETNEKKGGKKIRSLGTNQDRSHCFLLKTTQQIIKMCSKDSLDEYIAYIETAYIEGYYYGVYILCGIIQ
jgi:ADP-heptose:LPS heptosyltransferase